jgi:hypothetical protein
MNAEQETKVAANASCIMNAETFLRENHPKDGSEPNEAWNTVCYLLKYTKWLKEQYDTALREKREKKVKKMKLTAIFRGCGQVGMNIWQDYATTRDIPLTEEQIKLLEPPERMSFGELILEFTDELQEQSK